MAHPKKVALVFGSMFGGVHLAWTVLIALNWAQPLVNFSMWAHMVNVPVVVGPFDAAAAITVIVIAFSVGYAIGYVGATVWNKIKH